MNDKPEKGKQNKKAVSPINGAPTPRGKPFTSKTAREARQIRTEKDQAQKSITAAFLKYMGEVVETEKDGTQLTGAQAIAKSIIRGAAKGNAEMVKIALALTDETPTTKVTVSTGKLADLIDGLKEPCNDDIYAETTDIDGAVENEQAKTD